jgi:hypothetical protein
VHCYQSSGKFAENSKTTHPETAEEEDHGGEDDTGRTAHELHDQAKCENCARDEHACGDERRAEAILARAAAATTVIIVMMMMMRSPAGPAQGHIGESACKGRADCLGSRVLIFLDG